jgi:biotin transport system substrate-specific component
MNGKLKEVVTAAIMTAVLCVTAQIAFPLPFAGVVFSLGLFGVFLAGVMQKPKYAFLSVITYVLLGIVGVPVFAGYAAGFGTLLGPTGGFLMAYPFAAAVLSLFAAKKHGFFGIAAGIIAALMILYIVGGAWFAHFTQNTLGASLLLVAVPFIPFDIAKAALAVFIGRKIRSKIPE